MLSMMIVHMETAFVWLHSEPVFSVYPQAQNGQVAIFFPHAIQGTSLVAERVVAYNGPYVEDGSNDNVTGIAALALCNRGTQPLAQVKIELQQGTRRLTFNVQTILPGDAVLVLEANRQLYEKTPYNKCKAQVIPDTCVTVPSDTLRISVAQHDCISLTNYSDRALTAVWLEYKCWSYEYESWLGGITWDVYVGEIAPGQTKEVYIEHFCDNNCIVRVTYQ